ncbi:MAG: dTDP-4-dehydrorhamnose reductase [Microbacteriaceae bacterium]|nr:dTDP-4-dehydrorhamnose reductase [Microbacteriaceae bacterium]
MKYLILGGRGMLGTDLRALLRERDTVAPQSAELDIRDAAAVTAAATGMDVVINAAAYTHVDDAESHEDEARAVNALGAEHAARAAAEAGAAFVQVSTDYVFDGAGSEPYREDAPRHPLGAYGRTKAEGEERVLGAHPAPYIVRTAWLYGKAGRNFARTILTLAGQRDTVQVVNDQLGQPTWSADLASWILALVRAEAPAGIYHGTNAGSTTWFGFARALFENAGLDPERVEPTDSASMQRPAPRPAYSVLGHAAWTRAALDTPRPWRDALDQAFRKGVFDAELEALA